MKKFLSIVLITCVGYSQAMEPSLKPQKKAPPVEKQVQKVVENLAATNKTEENEDQELTDAFWALCDVVGKKGKTYKAKADQLFAELIDDNESTSCNVSKAVTQYTTATKEKLKDGLAQLKQLLFQADEEDVIVVKKNESGLQTHVSGEAKPAVDQPELPKQETSFYADLSGLTDEQVTAVFELIQHCREKSYGNNQ